MPQPFVHLHCHTDYSLLDGACRIPDLIETEARRESPAVAITDHGNMFGAIEFHAAARAAGIQPVIGCEVYTVDGDPKTRDASLRYNHLVLLCKNETGYRNLIDLVSSSWLEGLYYKPRIGRDQIAGKSEGLVCLSGCLRGDVQEALLDRGYAAGRDLAASYRDMFGKGNYFLEVQDHGLEQDKRLIEMQKKLGKELSIPLVASNDAHYVRASDAAAHDTLLCVQTGKTLADPNRLRFGSHCFHLRSREEMAQALGEGDGLLDRPWEIAQMCDLKIDPIDNPFPGFEVPQGTSLARHFEQVAREGMQRRLPKLEALEARGALRCDMAEYAARLDHEIEVIRKMQYAGYFLVVWDFVRHAREQGIPVGPGRGSAAGSLVAYAMGITDIDPLQNGLLFERFLNIERKAMPDVDVDFCMRRRGEVIRYITEKYGQDHVSEIITFSHMAARAAIRDAARVTGLPFAQSAQLAGFVPEGPGVSLARTMASDPRLAAAGRENEKVQEVLRQAARLEGVARHAGAHAAGVVIAPRPLRELVPLASTSGKAVVTQYDMKSLDKLGLLKADVLGLAALTTIRQALDWARERDPKNMPGSEDAIPENDPATYKMMASGRTAAVFQFESAGMRDLLRQTQPDCQEDLQALNALYRPGPLQGGMVPDFIARKRGRKAVDYLLPELEPILSPTHGVIVYQEQVMRIASEIGGYSLGEADLLRRAMGKKDVAEMKAQRDRFLEGAAAKGVDERKATRLFDLMGEFAGYGFNKSHAAAYALLSYRTAWLKTHCPAEYMAAALASEQERNTGKVRAYMNDCRESGLSILPPDINASGKNFTPSVARSGQSGQGSRSSQGTPAVRVGLASIKTLRHAAVESALQERESGGPFQSFEDFCERADWKQWSKASLDKAIEAGAFDSLGERADLLARSAGVIQQSKRRQEDIASGQGSLFGGEEVAAAAAPAKVEPLAGHERLQRERAALGFYLSAHPLDLHGDKIKELEKSRSVTPSVALPSLPDGANVRLCGVLHDIQHRTTKNGKPFARANVEDREGDASILLFGQNYQDCAAALAAGEAVTVQGKSRGGELIAFSVQSLSSARPATISPDRSDFETEEIERVDQEAEPTGSTRPADSAGCADPTGSQEKGAGAPARDAARDAAAQPGEPNKEQRPEPPRRKPAGGATRLALRAGRQSPKTQSIRLRGNSRA